LERLKPLLAQDQLPFQGFLSWTAFLLAVTWALAQGWKASALAILPLQRRLVAVFEASKPQARLP
jgi:hypothetical protein